MFSVFFRNEVPTSYAEVKSSDAELFNRFFHGMLARGVYLAPSAFEIMLAPGPLLFLALLMLVVRPLAVALSSWRTGLTWKEQAFLAWLAPRGIVAAAVASLFSFRLEEFFPAESERIVPVVFLVIVGTVAVYGLTIAPLARWRGLAPPDPQGMAKTLQDLGVRVLLIDANARNVRIARRAGLPAQRTNILAEGVIDDLELSGIGRLLAVTPNDEVNALAALHFAEVFESDEVYQLPVRSENGVATEIPRHLRGRPLFATDATYTSLDDRFDGGGRIRTVPLSSDLAWLRDAAEDETFTPLFIVRGEKVRVYAEDAEIVPQAGDVLVALVAPDPKSEALWREALEAAAELPADEGTPAPAEPPPVARA